MTTTARHTLPAPPVNLLDGASLFLDFDGTLVELASRPDAVKVGERLHELMGALLAKLEGRLAVVSGRSAQDVRALFAEPPFAVSGSHGLELYWPDGRVSAPPMEAQTESVLQRLNALRQRYPGVVIERKPFGFALHYRLSPEAEGECHDLAARIAQETGLTLQPGKMVVELKAANANKGRAVETFMREPPMTGTRPIFVGDDETDEAGFAMAALLGGTGVLVGAMRPTAAVYQLSGVDEALTWLEAASRALP